MAPPPVAMTIATAGCFMSALVASMEGSVIHWMQSAGAPAVTAASSMIWAAAALHLWALGWKARTMTFRPFRAMRLLNMVVEVGFVVGVTAAMMPKGSAISRTPSLSWMMPTDFLSFM